MDSLSLTNAYNAAVRASGPFGHVVIAPGRIYGTGTFSRVDIPIAEELPLEQSIIVGLPRVPRVLPVSGQLVYSEGKLMVKLRDREQLADFSRVAQVRISDEVPLPLSVEDVLDESVGPAWVQIVDVKTLANVMVAVDENFAYAPWAMVGADRHGNLVGTQGSRLAAYQPDSSIWPEMKDPAWIPRNVLSLAKRMNVREIRVEKHSGYAEIAVGGATVTVTNDEFWSLDRLPLNIKQFIEKSGGMRSRHVLSNDEIAFINYASEVTRSAAKTLDEDSQHLLGTHLVFRNGQLGLISPELQIEKWIDSDCQGLGLRRFHFDPRQLKLGASQKIFGSEAYTVSFLNEGGTVLEKHRGSSSYRFIPEGWHMRLELQQEPEQGRGMKLGF